MLHLRCMWTTLAPELGTGWRAGVQKPDLDGRLKDEVDAVLDRKAMDLDFVNEVVVRLRDIVFATRLLPGREEGHKTLELSNPKPEMTGASENLDTKDDEGMALVNAEVERIGHFWPNILHQFFAVEASHFKNLYY
ncbi:MAG: hypothetical protein Q9184_006912 [Pyrenodesmia sp. 2 TL-2023]